MTTDTLILILFDICLIIGLARMMGVLCGRIEQPPVIGEIIAGIMLGPSLLGWFWPEGLKTLFPTQVLPNIYLLSQIGLIFFMFLVGLDLSPDHIRGRLRQAVLVSNASIMLPFGLGVILAATVLKFLQPSATNDLAYTLFLGAAMSVTAFPVLARIVAEKNLQNTALGQLALTAASIDDVTAWCLLAMAIIAARSGNIWSAWPTLVGIVLFATALLTLGQTYLGKLIGAWERRGQLTLANQTCIYILLILTAIVTELLGIDVIFGGFLLGVIMPKDSILTQFLRERIQDFVTIFLLPLFFAYSGLNTQFGLVNSWPLWGLTGLIILAAIFGKFGGAFAVGKLSGIPLGEAAALGWLMNTRGLTELIILNIGLQLKVIPPVLFTMLVIMALVTTFIGAPLVDRFYQAPVSNHP